MLAPIEKLQEIKRITIPKHSLEEANNLIDDIFMAATDYLEDYADEQKWKAEKCDTFLFICGGTMLIYVGIIVFFNWF